MSKTIKVIELLNKIANGEEVPEKIKFERVDFTLEKDTYYRTNTLCSLIDYIKLKRSSLNEEIEIIEEEPEIDIQSYKELLLDQLREREHTDADIYFLGTQINALIRAVKQLDNQINNK